MKLTNSYSKEETGFCLNPENQSRRHIFKSVLTTIILLFAIKSFSITYYVSTSGNDANSGTSSSLPWRTLTKVNSFTPKAGDQILFKRGDEWIGTITVKASGTSGRPIVYGAYGTGNKPKIYGSEVITGWTLHSGNIYKAKFASDITQIFVDGKKIRLARLTNTGYNTINSVTSQTQFSSDALNPGFNYSGAKVMLRTENWFSIMRTVTSSNSKTLTINSAPAGTIKAKQGFLLMNKLEFLDSPGEWYYDTATDMVYLWTPNGDSPENYIIRGSTFSNGIVIGNIPGTRYFISVSNLNILQQKEKGISLSGGNITIDNNLIEGQEGFGIWTEVTYSPILIQNNVIDDVNGVGIFMSIKNSVIQDNLITNIGVFDKLGLNGTGNDNGGTGLEISGDGNTIEYNRIIGTNYNGIFWRGNSVLQYNFIKDVCLSKSDGGGIYTGGTSAAGSTLRYNIIDNVVGNHEGGITGHRMAEGIFLDEPSRNITCEYNTVVRCSNSGIMMFRNENHVVRHNTIMDTRYGIYAARLTGTVKSSITNNLIVANSASNDYEPRQLLVRYSLANASFDYNTYVCPFTSELVFRTSDGSYKNFAGWKTSISDDANSTFIGTKLGVGETQGIFYNDTKEKKSFYLGNSVYRDIYGKKLSGTLTLEPFTSIVLVKTTLINNVDNTDPIISSFIIPSNSTSFTVPISSFTATDNIVVTGYKLTETPTAPLAADAGWSAGAPVSYSFTTEGTKTLYAWAKDEAGNVSASTSRQVIISISSATGTMGFTDAFSLASSSTVRRAMPVTFNEAGQIQSISVYHNAGSGNVLLGVYSDVAGFPSALLGVTPSTAVRTTAGWQTVSLTTPVNVTSGQKVWLAWVFQNISNIRFASTTAPASVSSPSTWSSGVPSTFGTSWNANFNFSVYCTYTTNAVADVTKPIITAFTIPATSSSIDVAVSSFTASDNKAVTGFMLTESSTAPLAGDADWSAVAPVSYSFANEGTKTLYAWVKDEAGNVSASASRQVIISLSSTIATLGFTETFSLASSSSVRRAIPVTFDDAGQIQSISVYHNAGSGNVLLSVYSDVDGFPSALLGVTPSTSVRTTVGWQTVSLTTPVNVTSGQTVWLAWVFENVSNIRFERTSAPASVSSSSTWSSGVPPAFGTSYDANFNFSVYCTYTTNVVADVTKPIITAFTIPATSSSLVVPVSSFSASDNKAVTGFMLTESATAPLAGNADWSAGAPVSYSFATEGTKTIYAWAKDAAGNVSTSASRQVIISPSSATLTLGSTEAFSLASSSTIRRAIPVTFNEAGQIQSISVYHNAGSGNVLLSVYSDVAGFPSALLGVTPSTAVGTTEGWQTVSLTTPVNVTSGQKVWLAWVFQNAPYIRFVSTTTPASVSSPSTWSSGVPSTFGTSYNANFKFSVYCTYTATILKDATIPQDDQTEPTLKPLYAGNNNDEVYFSIEDSTDSQESNDFSLYPNPAKSFINVDYSVMPELGTTIEIFDSNGRMLYKEPAESTSNRIGISQFPVGLYFIRSISPQKYNVKKLIVK